MTVRADELMRLLEAPTEWEPFQEGAGVLVMETVFVSSLFVLRNGA
jgi:hypothetical protein